MQEEISKVIQEALDQQYLSGAIIQVNQHKKTIFQKAFGGETVEAQINVGNAVEVVAILPLILKLVERRRSKLALNHKLADYFPAFKEDGKENVQIMNLLTHTSGLSLRDFTEDLIFQPGTKVQYNEQNFQLLPAVFEMVSGYSFHTYYQEIILDPMLMEQTTLTEDYQLWTTISDLSRYATMIEQDGTYDYLKIINKKAVQLSKQNFTSFLNENRGLGWGIQGETDLKNSYSKDSYGYLNGRTTSFWFDPRKELNIVLYLAPFTDGEKENIDRIRREVYQIIGKNT